MKEVFGMAASKVKSLYQAAYQPPANQPLHLDRQKRRAFCKKRKSHTTFACQ